MRGLLILHDPMQLMTRAVAAASGLILSGRHVVRYYPCGGVCVSVCACEYMSDWASVSMSALE